ncbi:MAG: cytochrome c oxidase subunit 3 [Neomegalonema sp.]|nr:cytochrome c oxidase subunit 3 [Neomegalonema sp.]
MAGTKQHDYHIVDPSPWPFIGAIGAFVMLVGAVFWMNGDAKYVGGTPYMFIAGLGIILYTAYAWWSDVVKEAHAGHHTPVVKIGLRYGIILFIISEVMFFAAWFWMYFKHALYPMPATTGATDALGGANAVDGVWPPAGIELVDPWHLPLLNTLILLTSGATVTWAHHAIMENDRKGLVQGLLYTVLLGALFTLVQVYEYWEILKYGLFNGGSWIFGSSFFMATGFHGAHVLIGTIYLLVCLVRAARGHFDAKSHIGFEGAAWYWHFVDVVWLFLFIGIYAAAYFQVAS